MSLLLSGKIETIKTNVATLISRLTSTRAALLDNLDAAISSRAPSSTALSSAIWTSTKAGYLDQPISGISSIGLVPTTLPWGSGPASDYRRSNLEAFFDNTAANKLIFGGQMINSTKTAQLTTTFSDALSLTGPGVIDFLAIWRTTATESNEDVDLRIVIDGTTVLSLASAWQTSLDDTDGFVLIGDLLWDDAGGAPLYGGINYRRIPFQTSFALQLAAATSTFDDNFEMCARYYT